MPHGTHLPANPRRKFLTRGTGVRLLDTRLGDLIWLPHAIREFARDFAPQVAPDLAWLKPNPNGLDVQRAWSQVTVACGIRCEDVEMGIRQGEPALDDEASKDGFGRIRRPFRIRTKPDMLLFAVIEPSHQDAIIFKVITTWVEKNKTIAPA